MGERSGGDFDIFNIFEWGSLNSGAWGLGLRRKRMWFQPVGVKLEKGPDWGRDLLKWFKGFCKSIVRIWRRKEKGEVGKLASKEVIVNG